MAETTIPILVNEKLIALFYFDMIHDFSDSFDLTGDFEVDLVLYKNMFASIFGSNIINNLNHIDSIIFADLESKNRILSPGNYMEKAHEIAYQMSMSEGRYFWGTPQIRNGIVTLHKYNSLDEANDNGSMMTHSDADWAVLQAGTYYGSQVPFNIYGELPFQIPAITVDANGRGLPEAQQVPAYITNVTRPVYVIEDALQSTRQVGVMYNENANTVESHGSNTRNVISIKSLPGVYDEAISKLFVDPLTVQQNSFGISLAGAELLSNSINFMFSTTDSNIFVGLMKNGANSISAGQIPPNDKARASEIMTLFTHLIDKEVAAFTSAAVGTDTAGYASLLAEFKPLFDDFNQRMQPVLRASISKEMNQLSSKKDATKENPLVNTFFSTPHAASLLYLKSFVIKKCAQLIFSNHSLINIWMNDNWEEPGSAQGLIHILKNATIKSDLDLSRLLGEMETYLSGIEKDPTSVGNLFNSLSEIYYGGYIIKGENDGTTNAKTQYVRLGSISDEIIETIISLNDTFSIDSGKSSNKVQTKADIYDLPSGINQFLTKDSLSNIIFKIYITSLCFVDNDYNKIIKLSRQKIDAILSTDCKIRVCNYSDFLTASENGTEPSELPKNPNAKLSNGQIAYSISDNLRSQLFPNEDNNPASDLFIELMINYQIFNIEQSSSINIKNLLNTAIIKYSELLENISQVSIQFQTTTTSTTVSQHPSVTSVSNEFRSKLMDTYVSLATSSNKAKNAKSIQNVEKFLELNVKGSRGEGLSEELKDVMITLAKQVLSMPVTNEQYQELFLILFKKTFSDFSQIVIANYLSKNPLTALTDYQGSKIPQCFWTTSFDTMMTLIALYYGTNIIREGVSAGTLGKGFVNYGFANYQIVAAALGANSTTCDLIVKEDDISVNLQDILSSKNSICLSQNIPYQPGWVSNFTPDINKIITQFSMRQLVPVQGGKRRRRTRRQLLKKNRQTRRHKMKK